MILNGHEMSKYVWPFWFGGRGTGQPRCAVGRPGLIHRSTSGMIIQEKMPSSDKLILYPDHCLDSPPPCCCAELVYPYTTYCNHIRFLSMDPSSRWEN